MGGRPRTPTRVLEMRGSFQKDPLRRAARANEPQVTTPLGEPPTSLDEAEQARWRDIASWCHWLTVADRVLVEQTCQLWMAMRRRTGSPGQGKMLTVNLIRLGMTPADRSKVSVPQQPPKSKLDKFA